LVNHGWVTVNGKKLDIPSMEVKVGDSIAFNTSKTNKKYLKEIEQILKNRKDLPAWIDFNSSTFEGKYCEDRRKMRLESILTHR